MQKYKKAALNIAFLTMVLSVGITNSYVSLTNNDVDAELNDVKPIESSQDRKEKILNAFEQKDYQAWKKIIGGNNKLNSIISEFDFQNFMAARAAARNGQYNKAIKITEELKKGVGNKLL